MPELEGGWDPDERRVDEVGWFGDVPDVQVGGVEGKSFV